MGELISHINIPIMFMVAFLIFAILSSVAIYTYEIYLLRQFNYVEPKSKFGSRTRSWKLLLALIFGPLQPAMGMGLKLLILLVRFTVVALVICGIAMIFFKS